jgi:hypothetical protein
MIPMKPYQFLEESNLCGFGPVGGLGFYVPNGTGLFINIRAFTANVVPVYVKVGTIDKWGRNQAGEYVIFPTTDLEDNQIIIPVQECFIQSIHIYVEKSTNVLRGQIFAVASIRSSTADPPTFSPILDTLCADYVENLKPVTYPGSGVKSPTDGAGLVYCRTEPNVIDAGQFTYTVPDHMRQRILSMHFSYKVVAMGAAQTLLIQAINGSGAIVYEWVTAFAIGAGVTARINFTPWALQQQNTWAGEIIAIEPLPVLPLIVAGYQIVVTPSTSPQTGDAMSDIHFYLEQWTEPRTVSDPP